MKDQVVQYIRQNQGAEAAHRAEAELPNVVDTDREHDRAILDGFGLASDDDWRHRFDESR